VTSPTSVLTATITPWPYITWTPSQCDKLQFIADISIPDGTKISPGATFTKTWKVYNSGTCTWTKNYTMTYISGNPMGADSFKLTQSVAPGSYAEISVEFTAPDEPEDYSNFWRLRNPAGEIFGATLYVVIEVSTAVATATPTASPTPSATNTPVPTEVPPTKTPTPTGASS
jgi:hypothetical protein